MFFERFITEERSYTILQYKIKLHTQKINFNIDTSYTRKFPGENYTNTNSYTNENNYTQIRRTLFE